MEGTNALLASLVQTKSVERVLAPIANQVSQLIILNEAYEHGESDVFPPELVTKALEVQHSADELAAAALRYAHHSQDEVLKSQMPGACELLTVAGSNFLTASQRVDAENLSHGARRHLIRSAKDVLEGTLKVLLVSDDADVRKAVLAGKCLLDRLRVITGVATLQELVPAFKSFTEAMMLLINLVNRRQAEVIRPQQKERLIVSCSTLRKSVPMLSTAMQTHVKYPANQQAQSSKEFAVGQVIECVHDIIDALENKTNALTDEEYDEQELTGSFVGAVDKLVNMLSAERRLNVSSPESEFDVAVETAVRLSMSVAHLSVDRHRTLIIKNCQQILQQKTAVADMCRSLYENLEMSELRCDYDELCDQLIEEFEDLERHVAASMLQLTVEAFKESTEPLERLVKAALKPLLEDSPIARKQSENLLEPYIEAFHAHTDKMCQVARFIAAGSTQATNVRQLRSCLAQLERMDPEILPAVIKCRQDVTDPGALQHLRMLKAEWIACVELLVLTVDDATDQNNFIEVAELELQADASQCRRSLQMDASEVAEAVKPVIGGAHRLSHIVTRQVDNSTDVVYRNAVMVYINQLNKVIPAIKSAGNRLVNDPSKVSLHESLHKRCDLLLRCVDKVRQALHGTSQPDLLSDLRCNVRSKAVVKSLDFNDADEKDDLDHVEAGKSPHLTSASGWGSSDTIIPHSSAKVEEEAQLKQVQAMKKYVSDLTNDRLREAVKSLVSTAVAGQQQQVYQLCNDFLAQSNHVIELANSIASCNKTHEETLRQYASDVTNLTPQLLDKAHRVVAMDTYQIEPLHQTADLWASKVSYLEDMIDSIAREWVEVSEKVMDAGKMGNVRLLRAQLHHLEDHRRNVHTLLKAAFNCIDGVGDVVTTEKGHLLKDTLIDLDNQCAMFTNLADLSLHSDSTDDHIQLHQAGREWAAKVYCLLATVDLLSMGVISEVRGSATIDVGSMSNINDVQTSIRNLTAENMRWKAVIQSLDFLNSEDKHEDLRRLLDELDLLTSEMNDCLKVMMTAGAPAQSLEKLYSPHKLIILQWQWALKDRELSQLVDLMTMVFTSMLPSLKPDEGTNTSSDSIDKFRETFSSTRVQIIQVLQECADREVGAEIRSRLNELDSLTQQIISTSLQSSSRDRAQQEWLQRWWCCNAFAMTHLLKQILTPSTEQCVQDILVKLKGSTELSVLSVSCLSAASPISPSPQAASHPTSRLPHSISSGSLTAISSSRVKLESDFHSTPLSILQRGPRMVHTKPEPPSAKSGFRPRPKEHGTTEASTWKKSGDAEWEEKNDAIIRIAKEMTRQLSDMTEFTHKDIKACHIKSKEELISTAKLIARNGEELVKFGTNLADYCVDKRLSKDLLFYAEHVPSVATQLNILANVKAATPDDTTTEKMLIRNAENLMDAITKMLRAAEATSVKGYNTPPPESTDGKEAVVVATQWRRKLDLHRELESTFADTDELGLRKVNRESAGSTVEEIMKTPR